MKRRKASWWIAGMLTGFLLFVPPAKADPIVELWLESTVQCNDENNTITLPMHFRETFTGDINFIHITIEYDSEVFTPPTVQLISGVGYNGLPDAENWMEEDGTIPFGPRCSWNGFDAPGVYTFIASVDTTLSSSNWLHFGDLILYWGMGDEMVPFASNIKIMCGTPEGYPLTNEICLNRNQGCRTWGDNQTFIYNACALAINSTCTTYPWPECQEAEGTGLGECPHQYCLSPPKPSAGVAVESSTWSRVRSLYR